MMVLQNTTKVTYNENSPRNNSLKNSDIKIGDPPLQRITSAKYNENPISNKNYRAKDVGGLDPFYINIGAM